MPTIGNMPGADLDVTFGKLHPTVAALRKQYELDYFYDAPVRTWKDAAIVMRHFHDLCLAHIRNH